MFNIIYKTMMDIEEQKTPNRIFQFKPLPPTNNKLVNKHLNIILVDDKHNIVECKESQNEPTVIVKSIQVTRADQPLNLENCVSYFEVEILKPTQEDCINVGLMSKDCNNKQFLGKSPNSFGYLKGELYLDKKKIHFPGISQKLKASDRIGFGVNCHKRTFFIVKNDHIIHKGIEIPAGWNQFFPAVALTNQHEKVQFHFTLDKFKFKLKNYASSIENEVQSQILNSNQVGNSHLYSLVQQYLSFNNYSETLSLLNEKKIDFLRLNKYTKNPSSSKAAISLKVQSGMDEQMNEPLKIRSRIMSQRLNDDEGLHQIKRKNTQMVIEQVNNPRKCSLISNISNISNVPNVTYSNLSEQKYDQLLQSQFLQEFNQNEQFLQCERREIVEHIKNKRIEKAISIMEQRIPKILEDNYVMAFLKGHIFLRKVKEESNKEAINYSKQERELLKNNYGVLCPFYNSKASKVEWKPLSTIFLAMAFNAQAECNLPQNCCDLLSEEQFKVFSSFVNRLILNKMGYLSCSRLTYFVNHTKKIQEKLKQFKGMTCGIQLSI